MTSADRQLLFTLACAIGLAICFICILFAVYYAPQSVAVVAGLVGLIALNRRVAVVQARKRQAARRGRGR